MTYTQPNRLKCHALPSIEDQRDITDFVTTTSPLLVMTDQVTGPTIIIDVLAGPPGCRKSETMLNDAAITSGRYLFACLSTELADEQAARFRQCAAGATVRVVHSKIGTGDVGSRLSRVRAESSDGDHVAAFITHETLITTDLTLFNGWHLRIDESPNVTASGYLKLAKSTAYYEANFGLAPFEGGWSRVSVLGARASWKDIVNDTMGRTIKDFSAWATRPADLIIGLHSFAGPDVRKPVPWVALWRLDQLTALSSVTIAASTFIGSIAHRVWKSLYGADVVFREHRLGLARLAQPNITIHYFTQGHEGSTTFWDDQGHDHIVAVVEWLKKNRSDLGYWSGNKDVRKQFRGRAFGKLEQPKLAGLNRLRDATSCSMIYSAKSVEDDKPIIKMFGITKDEVQASREDEDIYQFVCRGAIRDLNYGGPYDAFVYSRSQAERLAKKLADAGYDDVNCVGVEDAGIMWAKRESAKGAGEFGDAAAAKAEQKKLKARDRQRQKRVRDKNRQASLYLADEVIGTDPGPS